MKCSNCGEVLSERAMFCHKCGQSIATIDRDFGEVLKEQLHELLDTDGRLVTTLKVLVTQPGELTRAYVAGQRMKYTPPLRLYLSISILFFLMFSYIYPVYSNQNVDTASMSDYYAKAMFVLFPIFALLVQVVFNKTRFIGNLVFSLHNHSLVYLVLLIIAPLEANEMKHIGFILLQIPPSLFLFWYFIFSFKNLFEESWFKTLAKAGVVFVAYMAILGFTFDVLLEDIV